jgi:uncharacterized protein YbjT (DUF2867 family)
MLEEKRIYVVIGSTSDVGSVVAAELESRGHVVRRVARSLGVSFDDKEALSQVFAGADGAYLMIPFDKQAPDLHERERQAGERLADAVKVAGVQRIVLLSGLNAHLRKGTSLGAALMEERLDALGVPELVHLRAGFIMENFTKGMGFIAQTATGSFSTPFRSDAPMPLIAAKDVGVRAAELLGDRSFPSASVQELHGSGDYTLDEATTILGSALGKPDLAYVQAGFTEARSSMIDGGFSPSFVDAVLETARSFNAREPWALEARSPRNTTPTTLPQWASQALVEAERV